MNWLLEELEEYNKADSGEERERIYDSVQSRLDSIGDLLGYRVGLYNFDERVVIYAFPGELVNSVDLKWKREEFFSLEKDGIKFILREDIGQLDLVKVTRMILSNGMFELTMRQKRDGGVLEEFMDKLVKLESCLRSEVE